MNCSNYFGVGKSGCVFGKKIIQDETLLYERPSKGNATGVNQNNESERARRYATRVLKDAEEQECCGQDKVQTVTSEQESNMDSSIETVANNLTKFTKRDQLKAAAARRFQNVAMFPSDETMRHMARHNVILNCPIEHRDIDIANKIEGPNKAALQGKCTGHQSKPVNIPTRVEVPDEVLQYYHNVVLAADILFVNQIPFLTTISRALHYTTVCALPDMKLNTIEVRLKRVIEQYDNRGFNVTELLVDRQFEGLKRRMSEVTVNAVSMKEHVPEVERLIRTLKERGRATFANVPFDKIPKRMVAEMMRCIVFYLNAFPWTDGVSQTMSPHTLLEGTYLDYNLHFQVIFGEFGMVYDGTDNTMNPDDWGHRNGS